jgi:hypothetical protein
MQQDLQFLIILGAQAHQICFGMHTSATWFLENERRNHPVQFKEVFLTQKYLAIAMEYADGGDMFQHVKDRQGLHEHEVHTPVHHTHIQTELPQDSLAEP